MMDILAEFGARISSELSALSLNTASSWKQMKLFDDRVRVDTGPASFNENHYYYLNRSGRSEAARIRALMESWFDSYPQTDKGGVNEEMCWNERQANLWLTGMVIREASECSFLATDYRFKGSTWQAMPFDVN